MPSMTHGIAPLKELPPDPTLWAEVPIAIADRDAEMTVALRPGARIRGRIEYDGVLPRPGLEERSQHTFVVERADGIESDFRGAYLSVDRFSTIQMPPGQYVIRPRAPKGWRLKSVAVNGRTLNDDPVDVAHADIDDAAITFTDRRSTIAGRIVREGPDDATRGWVTIFPTDREYWRAYGVYPRRIVFIESGRSGAFEAEVPPGSYYVAATRESTRGRLTVSQLTTLATSAAAVFVGDGQTVRQDVRFPRGQR
jgi:hypothetical protein